MSEQVVSGDVCALAVILSRAHAHFADVEEAHARICARDQDIAAQIEFKTALIQQRAADVLLNNHSVERNALREQTILMNKTVVDI